MEAAAALGAIGDVAAEPTLIELLSHASKEIRLAAAASLSVMGVSGLIGQFFFGWVSDRVGDPKRAAVLGYLVIDNPNWKAKSPAIISTRQAKGQAMVNLINIEQNEKIQDVLVNGQI
mgnify:CR=1 FL=1